MGKPLAYTGWIVPKATKWEVYRRGKSLGIIETDWAFANDYWSKRARLTGEQIRLKAIF